MDTDSKVELFFGRCVPKKPKAPGTYGILHILRYDLRTNMAGRRPLLWYAAFCIFAGIDLLGKFYAGNDDDRFNGCPLVRARFNGFIGDFFDVNDYDNDYDKLWCLRNSLMHSFGLYDKKNNIKFVLVAKKYPLVVDKGEIDGFRRYQIDLLSLYEQFELSVKKYRDQLVANEILRGNFEKMYEYYGTVTYSRNRKD